MLKTKSLARIIEAGLLEPEKKPYQAPRCRTCGRSVPKGCFCSERCREGYDRGWTWDEAREKNLKYLTPPIASCRLIAGRPEDSIGSNPYQAIVDHDEQTRRKIEKRKMRRNKLIKSMASNPPNL